MPTPICRLAPFALAALLAGQAPPAPKNPNFGEPPLLCSDEGSQVVAVGRDYKAVFGADGVTVVPRTGALAPTLPLHLRPLAATLAGTPLPLPDARFAHTDRRCERRSAAFAERYDLALESLEQSFVFDVLPQRGELVVDVGVTTPLTAVPDADGRGLRFVHEHATITFDRAVAIDANGRRRELAIDWHGDGYRLVVPADFVATAQLPLVVDPVVSTMVVQGPRLRDNTDIVWVPTTQRFVAVFDEQFSSNDWDIYACTLDATGALVGYFGIEATTTTALDPAIAYERDLDRLLVVHEHGANSTIRGRFALSLGTAPLNASFEIAGPSTGEVAAFDPDVGGNDVAGTALPRFQVVWASQSGGQRTVRSRQVLDLAVLTSPILVGPNPTMAPSIAPSRGGQGSWLVGIQFEFSPQNSAMAAFFLAASGGATPQIVVLGGSTTNTRFPEVSAPMLVGNVPVYCLVAHELAGSTWNIVMHLVQPGPFGPLSTWQADLTQLETSDPAIRAANQLYPHVAHDGSTFVVSYMELGPAGNGLDGYAACLSPSSGGLRLVEGRVPLGNGSTDERSFALAGTPNPRQVRGAFCRANPTTNSTDLVLPRLAASVIGVRATACLGLTATADGQPLPGETLTFTLAAGAFGGFVAGLPVAVAPLPGCNCLLGVLPQVVVASPFVLSIPATPTMVGVQVAVQGFAIGGQCLGSFRLSDTFDVTVH